MLSKNFEYEIKKQIGYLERAKAEGLELIEDPANLLPQIGQVAEVEVYLEQYTPKLLCKVFVKGTEDKEQAFHLIPLWSIIKYQQILPKPGDYFTLRCIIGVRRINNTHWIPSLRLPMN